VIPQTTLVVNPWFWCRTIQERDFDFLVPNIRVVPKSGTGHGLVPSLRAAALKLGTM
jgi:hypothetical protein